MKISEILSEEQLNELTFHGSKCKDKCAGHWNGYQWEKKHKTGVKRNTKSPSFNMGTELAINHTKAGTINQISTGIKDARGRFTKRQTGKK
jgi:hypothetical protein